MILGIAIASGFFILVLNYWLMFNDFDDFCECMSYAIQPDIYSWYKGELSDDWWAEWRIYIWIMISCAAGYGVHFVLSQFLN
jgi:hypothetical protein